jgi:hypothetical protein
MTGNDRLRPSDENKGLEKGPAWESVRVRVWMTLRWDDQKQTRALNGRRGLGYEKMTRKRHDERGVKLLSRGCAEPPKSRCHGLLEEKMKQEIR